MSEAINSARRIQKADLMKRILEVRYTDLELERTLCKQLLEVAEPEQDYHSCAFANLYLFDSHLALGEYNACDFYLIRCSLLCREHGYDDLLLVLCNLAGLYYAKISDEQTAIQYYLEGLKLARELADHDTESKLYNNMGASFSDMEDWHMCKEYFHKAYYSLEPYINSNNVANAISYLSNLAEICQQLNDEKGSEEALRKAESYQVKGQYYEIRLVSGWCAHYAVFNEPEKAAQAADKVLTLGFMDYSNKFFVYDMCIGLCENMLDIGDLDRAKYYLNELADLDNEVPLSVYFKIQQIKIRFWTAEGNEEELNKAYQEFYHVFLRKDEMDHSARAHSMLSKIQMFRVLQDREVIRRANTELESDSQIDGLTGLYNRRYFNKLISKVTQSGTLSTLGFIMIDVDYFKQYNDHYGHFAGDIALKAIGDILSEHAIDGISISRYGGDEYVCLCVNVQDEIVAQFVKDVAKSLEKRYIAHKAAPTGDTLTVSIGYSNEPIQQGGSHQALLQLADEALYQVKQAGRNGIARKRFA